ncbi:MAG: CocE/NonD family hydrolase [Dehalococcoidia bacterium]|nr:CocE/NonD family hydrolase [Dehalococcoidia bacterium]
MFVHQPVVILPNLEIPMRDGTILRADLYRPQKDGRYPTLLSRTPYNKSMANGMGNSAVRFAAAGYCVLLQDCRGRFSSDGDFNPFFQEINDGYDSVEWAAAQPWSTGKIGMFGPSYVGATQWLAAAARPPHLAAIVPSVTASDYYDGWTYQGGAFLLEFNLTWTLGNLALAGAQRLKLDPKERAALTQRFLQHIDSPAETMAMVPLSNAPVITDPGIAPYYRDWLAHPERSDYWERINIARHHAGITVPALNVGGWFDLFLRGTLQNYTGMRAGGGSPDARSGQRLIIGPWSHTTPLFGPIQGEVPFGMQSLGAANDLDGQAIRWFDYWLKGEKNGVLDGPPVRIFTLGAHRWRTAADWPLPGTKYVAWHLHSLGRANTSNGDGLLDTRPPTAEPPDTFLYDPRRPVPTRGGAVFTRGGAYDQRGVELRDDILVYTSPPLEKDMEVTGPLSVTLWASSSAEDTDFTAKLVDVSPTGFAMNLADNILRARYRNGMHKAEMLKPGVPYAFTIDLLGTSNLFKKGHRIRVEIASSNFPRFDRHPNTGGVLAEATEMRPALQTVYHDASRPSHIVLPVVDN